MMAQQFQLLLMGPCQLFYKAQPVAGLSSAKMQALLAYLAVEAEQAHTREFLAELLWPERPAGLARQNLRQTLTRLQRALPSAAVAEPLLLITRQGLQFNQASATWVDLTAFTTVLTATQQHTHTARHQCQLCCQQLASAVTHYRGDFLLGLAADSPAFEEWALLKREWLRRAVLQALDTLVQHQEAQQDWETAYQYAWRRVELDPLLEAAHQQVMRALAADGRRNEALAQYETLCRLLLDEIGVEPARETTALYEAIYDGALDKVTGWQGDTVSQPVPPHPVTLSSRHDLPVHHTPFHGRQRELVQLEERLADPHCHLLTLVGPGGAGKTRLALEAAHRVADHYRDGIWFVDLSTVETAEQLLFAVADALAYPFPDQAEDEAARLTALTDYLQAKALLLLLDNYEQLTDFVALPLALLERAPGVQLLVTSRQPLHLHAEWLLDIAGLAYPADPSADPSMESALPLAQYEAVQFFAALAQRLLADFTLSPQTTPLVGRLCWLVQGMPLALELAAAQLRQVALPTLVTAISRNLDVLATTMRDVPERHRTLRAVFDQSWALLDPALQRLFCQLAVFHGPFTAAAATSVTATAPDLLTHLQQASLLRSITVDAVADAVVGAVVDAAPATEVRYALHLVLHQYAAEKLAAQPELAGATHARHAQTYLALVAAEEATLQGAAMAAAVARLRRELDNIRAAWQWAATHGNVAALAESAHGLLRYFVITSQSDVGISLFGTAITALRDQPTSTPPTAEAQHLLADLYALRARLFFRAARYADAIADARAVLAVAELVQATKPATLANLYWGMCLVYQGEYAAARPKLEACRALAQSIQWRKLEGDSLRALGIVADHEENLPQARTYYEASLVICREIDDPRGLSACLGNLGSICRRQGDFGAAKAFLEQSLAIHRDLGDRSSEGRTFSHLGELSVDLEEYAQAERFFTKALHLLRAIGEAHHAADALTSLGELYQRQGNPQEAIRCWQEALSIYTAANETANLQRVQGYLQGVQT